ncbi:MAG: 3-deoxy-D-manno-octulosonic acid transferase, partial [Deltaproteobacteria bacterium]|nr:3-deoxy-D-manno-octulosonic acid transferase [Deltaproteobacteria bacterium]
MKIWIHAVSVGEVLAAISLIKGIKKVSPEAKIYLSTITVTGQAVAQAKAKDLVASIFYLPFDIFPLISKAVSDISPDLLVIMETEIWPNLIVSAKKRGVFVAIANGRISDKSFPWYRPFRFFFKRILERVDLFLMQSNLDRDRILALGAPPDRVKVTKNLKYDIDKVDTEHLLKLKETIRREAAGRKIIVAGST